MTRLVPVSCDVLGWTLASASQAEDSRNVRAAVEFRFAESRSLANEAEAWRLTIESSGQAGHGVTLHITRGMRWDEGVDQGAINHTSWRWSVSWATKVTVMGRPHWPTGAVDVAGPQPVKV